MGMVFMGFLKLLVLAVIVFEFGLFDPNDCCEWEGVVCNNKTGRVIKLHLPGELSPKFRVKGEIHESLVELQYLMYLNLSGNNFENSSIPQFLGSLTHLTHIDLNRCNLGGNIPTQLGLLSHLQYLDLSVNIRIDGTIQLGNLSQLQYLDLSSNSFKGVIPYQLGNLSQLQYLHLSCNALEGVIPCHLGNPVSGQEWLSSLTSLTHLTLEYMIDLKYSHKWLQMIAKLPNLKELSIGSNDLSNEYILSLPSLKFNSSSLSEFDLSWNNFKSSIVFHWIFNVTTNFVDPSLYSNHPEGPVPSEIACMMNSLENLDFESNEFKGGFESLGNIYTLRSLSLSGNLLNEDLSTIIQTLSPCAKCSLQYLDLGDNQITGTLVNLSMFLSLKNFDISRNLLNGTIPEDYQFPSSLVSLDIHSNSFNGTLTNSHLDNMHNLTYLDLSDNTLTLKFSHNWVPPFQLEAIYLGSCKLGPDFPKWLQTQNNVTELDISNAGISGTIPGWFWSLLTPRLENLNISCNNLSGTIPDIAIEFIEYSTTISLASNKFEGSIPEFLQNARALFLSNNRFSELHLFLCANSSSQVMDILDLSNNQLCGQLPDCWSNFKSLIYLDLSDNKISGELPHSIGSLEKLRVLILRNNWFTGEFPFTLRSWYNLEVLDVGKNKFSGRIPSWSVNELKELRILILRNNNISGSLSTHLCYLSNLHFLDLSLNILSGQIPECFKNFTPMALESIYYSSIPGRGIFYFVENSARTIDSSALLMWKGQERIFKHDILVKGIDLSSNKLTGKIPPELGMLLGLVSLNLSRNQLDGHIPLEIGQLTSLDSLDLSRNHLFGPIPSSFAQIDRLAVLDLSYNKLSGKIPTGTQLQSFNSSSYEGNLGLCGKPLEIKCPREKQPQESIRLEENNDTILLRGFYWSMTFGFIFGFWGIFGPVLFNRSWRHSYFNFLNNVADNIYVMVALNITKCTRWLKS